MFLICYLFHVSSHLVFNLKLFKLIQTSKPKRFIQMVYVMSVFLSQSNLFSLWQVGMFQ